jgi:hypothetical protein
MSRLTLLSLAIVAFSIAILLTGRAAIESDRVAQSAGLLAEVDALAGQPPSAQLSKRVTDAAQCYPRMTAPDKACLYVWSFPDRTDYLRLVAWRLNDRATQAAILWGVVAVGFWILTVVLIWKAIRWKDPRSARRRAHQVPTVGPSTPAGPSRT